MEVGLRLPPRLSSQQQSDLKGFENLEGGVILDNRWRPASLVRTQEYAAEMWIDVTISEQSPHEPLPHVHVHYEASSVCEELVLEYRGVDEKGQFDSHASQYRLGSGVCSTLVSILSQCDQDKHKGAGDANQATTNFPLQTAAQRQLAM